MYWGYDHYWGMHVFWWFFWVVVVSSLLFTGWPRSRMTERDRAIDALRTRFASGEIDEAEYRARLDVLQGAEPRDRETRPAA